MCSRFNVSSNVSCFYAMLHIFDAIYYAAKAIWTFWTQEFDENLHSVPDTFSLCNCRCWRPVQTVYTHTPRTWVQISQIKSSEIIWHGCMFACFQGSYNACMNTYAIRFYGLLKVWKRMYEKYSSFLDCHRCFVLFYISKRISKKRNGSVWAGEKKNLFLSQYKSKGRELLYELKLPVDLLHHRPVIEKIHILTHVYTRVCTYICKNMLTYIPVQIYDHSIYIFILLLIS